jgi:hypothetical protein
MAIGHYQKAMYDFGTAIRFDETNLNIMQIEATV